MIDVYSLTMTSVYWAMTYVVDLIDSPFYWYSFTFDIQYNWQLSRTFVGPRPILILWRWPFIPTRWLPPFWYSDLPFPFPTFVLFDVTVHLFVHSILFVYIFYVRFTDVLHYHSISLPIPTCRPSFRLYHSTITFHTLYDAFLFIRCWWWPLLRLFEPSYSPVPPPRLPPPPLPYSALPYFMEFQRFQFIQYVTERCSVALVSLFPSFINSSTVHSDVPVIHTAFDTEATCDSAVDHSIYSSTTLPTHAFRFVLFWSTTTCRCVCISACSLVTCLPRYHRSCFYRFAIFTSPWPTWPLYLRSTLFCYYLLFGVLHYCSTVSRLHAGTTHYVPFPVLPLLHRFGAFLRYRPLTDFVRSTTLHRWVQTLPFYTVYLRSVRPTSYFCRTGILPTNSHHTPFVCCSVWLHQYRNRFCAISTYLIFVLSTFRCHTVSPAFYLILECVPVWIHLLPAWAPLRFRYIIVTTFYCRCSYHPAFYSTVSFRCRWVGITYRYDGTFIPPFVDAILFCWCACLTFTISVNVPFLGCSHFLQDVHHRYRCQPFVSRFPVTTILLRC